MQQEKIEQQKKMLQKFDDAKNFTVPLNYAAIERNVELFNKMEQRNKIITPNIQVRARKKVQNKWTTLWQYFDF